MMSLASPKIVPVRPPQQARLAPVVESLGTEHLGATLGAYLYSLCGADHFAAFRIDNGALSEVVASSRDPARAARRQITDYVERGWWRRDPVMTEAQRCVLKPAPSIIHVDFSAHDYAEMRAHVYPRVRDRLLLCGHRHDAAYGLSVLVSDAHAPFAADAIDQLGNAAELLVSLLAKHQQMARARPNVAQSLATLEEIEKCILAMSELPRRESEVCARVLYGMSTVGISLDLGISEETVKTYRKRAYQRLSIGCERELLTWYLALWSRWRGERLDALPRPPRPQVMH